jgi:hypothetical protein
MVVIPIKTNKSSVFLGASLRNRLFPSLSCISCQGNACFNSSCAATHSWLQSVLSLCFIKGAGRCGHSPSMRKNGKHKIMDHRSPRGHPVVYPSSIMALKIVVPRQLQLAAQRLTVCAHRALLPKSLS